MKKNLKTAVCLFIAGLGLLASGCNQYDPTKLSDKEMAAEIVDAWKGDGAVSAELTKVQTGFEGTVKMKDGETLKVTVTNDPGTKSAMIKSAGDRGTFLEYRLKAEKK